MSKASLQEQIANLSEPLLDSLGLELWGLEYLPSTGRALLRIYIERKAQAGEAAEASGDAGADAISEAAFNGAGINECTEASRLIGLNLEVEDLIPSAYILEVSTPGLERRFFRPAQLAAAQGELVDIQLEQPLPSHPFRKKFAGRLVAAEIGDSDSWNFTLELREPAPEEEPMLRFGWGDVKKAKLIHIEPVKEKPGKKQKNVGKNAGAVKKAAAKPSRTSRRKLVAELD